MPPAASGPPGHQAPTGEKCATCSVLWIPRGQLRLCGECKQDWLMVACDPHRLCFLPRVPFHPTTAIFCLCFRVTIAPGFQSWAGLKPTRPSLQWPPLRPGLVGRDTESLLQVVLQSKQSLPRVPLLCAQERGVGRRGRAQGGQFPCEPSVNPCQHIRSKQSREVGQRDDHCYSSLHATPAARAAMTENR